MYVGGPRRIAKCVWLGGALALALSVLPSPVMGEEAGPSKEVWAGAEVTARSWTIYSGITAALWGPIDQNGWRVRAISGYGAYSYDSFSGVIHGDIAFADLLAGYQHQFGPLTIKGFVGVAAESHNLTPFDFENEVVGPELGFKAALETWWEIGPKIWSSLDLSGSSLYGGTYSARARAGYRLRPQLSVGLETAASGNAEYNGSRGGAFVRYTWSSGEVSASAGASIDRSGESSGYGSINALYRF